ncbi:hypothetical protein HPY42_01060 [Coprothermobacteraceae bacterium]|nr:hypothetical protein [Coprothermobacteraceae bacterium]
MQHTFVVEFFPKNEEKTELTENALKQAYVVNVKEGKILLVTVKADSYEEGRQKAEALGRLVFGDGSIRVRRANM